MKTKICPKCKKELRMTEFCKEKRNKNGRHSICKFCQQIYRDTHKEELKIYSLFPNSIYSALKRNAKIVNREFFINKKDFIEWYNNQPKICHYCGRTVEEVKQDIREKETYQSRLSIDRKNNNKGYTLENIVLACRRCNSIKGEYLTEQEMLEIGKIIKWK